MLPLLREAGLLVVEARVLLLPEVVMAMLLAEGSALLACEANSAGVGVVRRKSGGRTDEESGARVACLIISLYQASSFGCALALSFRIPCMSQVRRVEACRDSSVKGKKGGGVMSNCLWLSIASAGHKPTVGFVREQRSELRTHCVFDASSDDWANTCVFPLSWLRVLRSS